MYITGMKDNYRIEKSNIKAPSSILVVEDNDTLVKLIIKVLKKASLNVKSASKGAEAIDYVLEKPNTLILLDQNLPDMTGEEVIETLRVKLENVYFIIMTGYSDERFAAKMMKLGARDHLLKDAKFAEHLPTVVEKIISQIAMEKGLE